MANDIDKTSPHYKGEFGSIYEVNQKFPSGGVEGDYVAIDGWAHYWNADRGTWCVNAQRDSYWDELITGIIEKFKLFKGATYMGVAGLDSVPAKAIGAKIYYFATVAGTYKNFGGLVVPQGINVLYSENGSSWVCSTLLEVTQELGVSLNKVMSQKAVNTELGKKANKADMNVELGKKFDKTSVAQDSGDSEQLVMSQNAVSSKLSDLSEKMDNISKENIADEDEEIIIGESEEDYVLKINKKGTDFKALKNNGKPVLDKSHVVQELGESVDNVVSQKTLSDEINSLKAKTSNMESSKTASEDEEIIIGESEEDYVLKINKKGVSAIGFYRKTPNGNYELIDTHKLTGKKVVGIGDSLSQSGYYEKDFCDISGADYVGVYSVGGTFTPPNGSTSTQDRAKKLIESGKDVDIILLENINDGWFAYSSLGDNPQVRGSINDESFMLSQYVNVDTDKVSREEAILYFRTNFQNIVNSIENKQKGTVVRIKYNTKSYVLTVTNDASNSGELVVTTKSTPKTITITSGMSKEDIAKKIYEYAYDGYEKSINGNVVTLVAKASTSTIPVIDAGTTGVVVQIDTSESATYTNEYFYGYTAEEFVNDSNWKDDYISLYSLYKGVIEYLQTNKPNAEIVFVMPAVWNLSYNDQSKNADCRNSDGSYNIDKCYQTKEGTYYQQKAKLLRQIQTEVAELYSIKYIDLHKNCGITPFNISEYYNPGDVHPKRHTYTLWAKEIYKLF